MTLIRNTWRYGDQDQIKVAASADLTAGQVLVVGDNIVGIVLSDTPRGSLANIATSGVWEMLNAGSVIASGTAVYWDDTEKTVTATAETNPYLGVAIPPNDATENGCYVALRQRVAEDENVTPDDDTDPAENEAPAAFTPVVSSVTDTGASVAFSTTDSDDDALTYKLAVTASETPPSDWSGYTDVTSPQAVTELTPETVYYAHVRAFDGKLATVGTSASFTTLAEQ